MHYMCSSKELRDVAYLQLILMKWCILVSVAFRTLSYHIKMLGYQQLLFLCKCVCCRVTKTVWKNILSVLEKFGN